MKTILRILIFLVALSLYGCKTKERATEKLTETSHLSSSQTQMRTQHTEQHGQTSVTEETEQTSWSDSIVERFHERIVTDSTGRVLLHEQEHTKDHYKGSKKDKIKCNNSSEETTSGKEDIVSQEQNDSIDNKTQQREERKVKTRSSNWPLILALPGFIIAISILISRVRRR